MSSSASTANGKLRDAAEATAGGRGGGCARPAGCSRRRAAQAWAPRSGGHGPARGAAQRRPCAALRSGAAWGGARPGKGRGLGRGTAWGGARPGKWCGPFPAPTSRPFGGFPTSRDVLHSFPGGGPLQCVVPPRGRTDGGEGRATISTAATSTVIIGPTAVVPREARANGKGAGPRRGQRARGATRAAAPRHDSTRGAARRVARPEGCVA